MKYSLLITQTSYGESTTVAVDADGEIYEGMLVLRYTFDGADYSLQIGNGEMVQTRSGAIGMHMTFAEGRTTAARFNDGESGGEFPVFTSKLEIKFDGEDCAAECDFSYGEGGETVNLSVTANVLQ